MGPPNPHEGEKNAVEVWGWVGGPGVWGGGSCPSGPGGDVAGKSVPHKPG